jgi:hypothetical protein
MQWTPFKRQADALSRREREILYGGARGGGKTACGQAWLTEPEYISHPKFRGLVIRKSFKDLNDWVSRARIMYSGIAEVFTHPAEVRFTSGATVVSGHWGDPSAIGQYLGHEYQKMLLEELTDIFAEETDYLKLLGSLRSSVPGLIPQLFATTNPGGIGHSWVKKRWVDVAYNKTYYDPHDGNTRIFIPSKVDDNPAICQNDPEYIKYLDSLPERLRKAWRDGSWDLAEGAFFNEFRADLMIEQPFEINESECQQRLFAGMDIGATHATAFVLFYVDKDDVIHTLYTYCNKLTSIRDHAKEIKHAIESFRWTKGNLPITCWVGRDAWTKTKLSEMTFRAPIDEFIEAMPKIRFEEANDRRDNGCAIMQDLFRIRQGRPQVYYWDRYNQAYVDAIPSVPINPSKREEYLKTNNDSDDITDAARYGLVGIYTWLTGERKASAMRIQTKAMYDQQSSQDWYNV